MRPYGVRLIEFPGVGDIQAMGSKGRVGHFPGKSGECRSYIRSPAAKATTRRRWARKARKVGRDACTED